MMPGYEPMPPTNPPPASDATPTPGAGDVGELERLARAAGGWYWSKKIRPQGKRPRAYLFAFSHPTEHSPETWRGQVACFWDSREVSAVTMAEFAEAASPAAVLALIAERDALRAAVEKALVVIDGLEGQQAMDDDHHAPIVAEIRAALARGPAAGETTDGGGKD
jgi:hypothetical protein